MPLTHFDGEGHAHMVDVSDKDVTDRIATAKATVVMAAETLELVTSGTAKKGDVLGVARLAGIMAAKKTSELIPLCHPLPITRVSVDLDRHRSSRGVRCGRTGGSRPSRRGSRGRRSRCVPRPSRRS